MNGRRDRLVDLLDALEVEGLLTAQTQRVCADPLGELQGQHTHANEVGAVDALVALGDDDLDAQQHGALGGPVA